MLVNLKIDVLNSLTLTELAVLRYIDANKKEVLKMSVKDIAGRNFVSSATVMRLAKKIGFSGFLELKYWIKEKLINEEKRDETLSFDIIVDEHLKNIIETKKLITRDLILKVVNKMNQAKNIHFFGKGLTNTITTYYSKVLFTHGINNFIYEDTHIAYLAAEKMNATDLVFIGSLSGNTNQAVRLAQIAKSRGATIISLTSNTPNSLNSISDIPLTFSTSPQNIRVADSVSRTPALFIFDIVIEVLLALRDNIKI